MKKTLQITTLPIAFTLITACGGGGGGGAPSTTGNTSETGNSNNTTTETADFEYPDEFYFIGNATELGLLFKQKVNMTYFYLIDHAAAYGAQTPFFTADALRTASKSPNIHLISCEVGSATLNGDEIYANMWNFVVFNEDCERPTNAAYHGKITVNEIAQSGPDEGNIEGTIGNIADNTPFYRLTSDGLASERTKGYLGDYSKIYDNGSSNAFSININSLRLSNYLADTQPDYSTNSSSSLTKTIRDYSQKTNEDSKLDSLKFRRTWKENGRDFTITFEGHNLDPEAGTGSYTFSLDDADSDQHDVSFNANFFGTYMILTHKLNGKTESATIEFY